MKKQKITTSNVPLREKVYQYIRSEMQKGNLLPGSLINLKEISKHLGLSITPLRDAVIQLDNEGLVTIQPRRGIVINKVTLQHIRNSLQIIGALESAVLLEVFDKIDADQIQKMEDINADLISIIGREAFETYYQRNIDFHNVVLDLSENEEIPRLIMPLKQRLYDFPRRSYIKEWELINCKEHDQFIKLIKKGKRDEVAKLWKDSHWSYKVHEKFIRRFYFDASERIENELSRRT
ncbi:MAG: GntR family transcriptional regulator [Deltaproteobacteria bacterium]|nr:GntR family transcriptional regulator [Deltaproteobacteria bacterium]